MTQRVDKDSLPLNQPRRTPSHPTKSHIVKTKVDGKEKIIRFGEQGASTAGKPKEGESDRMKAKRASFKSRHAKNIAKGPSSPAYWANKVKWADGGFVRTNYAAGDSVRVQPQNAVLGSIADFLKQTYSPRRTQQLQGTMEFLGVPALARTTERLSYGQPITNVNKANVPMLPDDTAEAAMLVAPPLTSLAKRVGTNLVQTAPYVARDIMQNVTSPLKSYAVKPKGGNWEPARGSRDSVTMSVNPIKRNPDVISGDMINAAAGEDLWSKMVDMDVYHYPASWLRENRPDVLNNLLGPEKGAVNKWLDNKLEKYIRNDMGTPDDPIRLAHEEGFSHIPGNAADDLGAWLPEDVAAMRVKAGYPEEGFAVKRHAEAGFPEATEANARKAELWENLADTEITSQPAGTMKEAFRLAEQFSDASSGNKALVQMKKDNPWIEKLDRETPIYKIDRPMDLNENLGFGHMADEIENMLDPTSGLPAALRMTPQQLDKVTMKQMVEKVDAVNKWRAEEASKAELGDMMSNMTATPRLQIPNTQLSFVKEPGMTWVDIPATVDESALKLCTTIGKQAGWCTQGEGLAKSYGSGDRRLTTLLDAEGRPHAQAMTDYSPEGKMFSNPFNRLPDSTRAELMKEVESITGIQGWPSQNKAFNKQKEALDELMQRPEIQAQLNDFPEPPRNIVELKPVENTFNSERAREYKKRDPQYEQKITDSVVEFLNSGKWGRVNDLDHYDIVDLKDTTSLTNYIKQVFGDESGKLPMDYVTKFNQALIYTPDAPRFMTSRQFRDFVEPNFGKEGYAEGGSVMKTAAADLMKFLDAQGLTMADLAAAFGKRGLPLSAAFYSGDLGKDEDLELRARRMQKPTITEAKYGDGGPVRAGEGLPDPTFSNLRVYADTVSQEMFPSERDQTKRDAARHMIASAIAAQKTNPTVAGLLGKAYEFKEAPFRTAGHWMGLSEPRSDYPTDVHNNELGIQLGRDNRSLQDLLDSVEREAKRGTVDTQKGRASLKPDAVKSTRYAEGGSVSYDPTQVDHIMNSIGTPRLAEGGEVETPDIEFSEDPEAMRLYKHAMKQVTSDRSESNVNTGLSARVAGGELSAGLDMNRMTQGERDQLMKALAANYNTNFGDVNVNARVQKPLDAKDVYAGMLNGSIPLGTGRAMLGVQGMKTPQGMGVTGYNAGWSGQVGPGNLSANVNVPKRGGRSTQVQYQIPFAEGGSVSAYDPNRVDAILNEIM
jgi:hypothetical protein